MITIMLRFIFNEYHCKWVSLWYFCDGHESEQEGEDHGDDIFNDTYDDTSVK